MNRPSSAFALPFVARTVAAPACSLSLPTGTPEGVVSTRALVTDAPMLSSSWGGGGCSHPNLPVDDDATWEHHGSSREIGDLRQTNNIADSGESEFVLAPAKAPVSLFETGSRNACPRYRTQGRRA